MSYGLIREVYTKTLTDAVTTLFEQAVNNVEFIMLEVEVTGSPLTSFTIQMRGHSASDMSDMFSSSADYTNPQGLLRGAGCDMTSLNGKSWIMLDVRAIQDIGVKASSSGNSNIVVRIGG